VTEPAKLVLFSCLAWLLMLGRSCSAEASTDRAVERVHAVLVAMAPYSAEPPPGETPEQRAGRLRSPARAAVQATSDPLIRAAVLVQGKHESRYARYVGEGRCSEGPRGSRCDPDRAGKPRAATYWQVWRAACPAAHAVPPGTERDRAAARCTAALLRYFVRECGSLEGAFHALKSGCPHRSKSPAVWAVTRAREARALAGRM